MKPVSDVEKALIVATGRKGQDLTLIEFAELMLTLFPEATGYLCGRPTFPPYPHRPTECSPLPPPWPAPRGDFFFANK